MTLKDELIKAIEETDHFDMREWMVEGVDAEVPSCDTASCMAGFIVGLRPELAIKHGYNHEWYMFDKRVRPDAVARKIWEEEMGEPCRLDFLATNYKGPVVEDEE